MLLLFLKNNGVRFVRKCYGVEGWFARWEDRCTCVQQVYMCTRVDDVTILALLEGCMVKEMY